MTAGNVNDSECAIELLQAVQIGGKKVLAYSSSRIRDYIEKNGAKFCIPDKINFKKLYSQAFKKGVNM